MPYFVSVLHLRLFLLREDFMGSKRKSRSARKTTLRKRQLHSGKPDLFASSLTPSMYLVSSQISVALKVPNDNFDMRESLRFVRDFHVR